MSERAAEKHVAADNGATDWDVAIGKWRPEMPHTGGSVTVRERLVSDPYDEGKLIGYLAAEACLISEQSGNWNGGGRLQHLT